MARILTEEETRIFRNQIDKAKKAFDRFDDDGWLVEGGDGALYFFNNATDQLVVSSYTGRLISCDGTDVEYARQMVNAYMPRIELESRFA